MRQRRGEERSRQPGCHREDFGGHQEPLQCFEQRRDRTGLIRYQAHRGEALKAARSLVRRQAPQSREEIGARTPQ